MEIRPATDEDIEAILPLMLAYCDFYEVEHPDEKACGRCRAGAGLRARREGFPADRGGAGGPPVGFAACGWKWSSLRGARCVVMEDLYVDPARRARASPTA